MRKYDLTGQTFGMLTVIERVADPKKQVKLWRCRCECGGECIAKTSELRRGDRISCGCWSRKHLITHGGSVGGKCSPLYVVWSNMRQRCTNPKNKNYELYGGRGIKVCEEWNDFATFREWAIQSGYKANPDGQNCSIDRIDVNGNYEPNNCRWVDATQQNRNKRNTIWLTLNGETKALTEWCEILGVNPSSARVRIFRGRTDPEEILFGRNQPITT